MGADRIIYIRTDGNSLIASGHLVRCFSIAQACKGLGMDVRFLVSDEESADLLKEIGSFPVLRLKTAAYNDLDRELPEVISLLTSVSTTSSCVSAIKSTSDAASPISGVNVIDRNVIYFIDSYFVTEKYLTSLRPFAKVVYLDDLQLFDYPADLLINYDVIPDSAMPAYKAAYKNAEQLLLGAAYTPLRSQFQNRKITVREQVSDILITTGGSDPYHFCLKLVQHLCDFVNMFSDKNLHIVIGKLNTDGDTLFRLTDKYPFLQLHENVSDMASLMEHCDLAVSASGTTLYELCAMGIPTISFTMADNQLIAAKAFEDAGAIPCAGDIRTDEVKVLQAVTNFMTEMSQLSKPQPSHTENMDIIPSPTVHSYEIRKSAHKAMCRLVDGNGAMRIANALMKI